MKRPPEATPRSLLTSVLTLGRYDPDGWCLVFEKFVSLPYRDRDDALRCAKLHRGCGDLLYMIRIRRKVK